MSVDQRRVSSYPELIICFYSLLTNLVFLRRIINIALPLETVLQYFVLDSLGAEV
jgi:hypothetical protein